MIRRQDVRIGPKSSRKHASFQRPSRGSEHERTRKRRILDAPLTIALATPNRLRFNTR